VIGARPEDFYGNSKYICDESEGAVMEIIVLIQKKDVVEIHYTPTFEIEP